MFAFLGQRLSEEREVAQEAMTLLLFNSTTSSKPRESEPPVNDALPAIMFRAAADKMDTNDLVGAARCAHEAVQALEALFKYGTPGMAVAPAKAAE